MFLGDDAAAVGAVGDALFLEALVRLIAFRHSFAAIPQPCDLVSPDYRSITGRTEFGHIALD